MPVIETQEMGHFCRSTGVELDYSKGWHESAALLQDGGTHTELL